VAEEEEAEKPAAWSGSRAAGAIAARRADADARDTILVGEEGGGVVCGRSAPLDWLGPPSAEKVTDSPHYSDVPREISISVYVRTLK